MESKSSYFYSDLTLLDAIDRGDEELVRHIIHYDRAQFYRSDEKDRTPLWWACSIGNKQIVAILVEAGASPSLDVYALLIAVNNKHAEVVDFMLAHGAPVEGKKNGKPLSIAAEKGDLEMVKVLLKHGAALDDNAIILASRRGFHEVVRVILAHFGKSDDQMKWKDCVYLSAANGYHQTVQVLMEYGGSFDPPDAESPLYWACLCGHLEVVKVLMKFGATVQNICSEMSPLMIAVKGGRWEIVQVLAQHGADVNVKVFHSRSTLHFACDIMKQSTACKMVAVLIQHGADVNAVCTYSI